MGVMGIMKAGDVAKYFLSLSDPDIGDSISNLKLQKLVYYAQGFHLAMFDSPLFDEEIKAWQHGPVVPDLYYEYQEFKAGGIPIPDDIDFSVFDDPQKDLLNEIFMIYGQYSAWKLRDMTHEEEPWRTTPINSTITHKKLKDYFKTRLVNGEE